MVLHLIRHGKTSANERRLYCGRTDLCLSENGVAEIERLKSQGVYPAAPDIFLSSGLARADQTIRLIYGKACRVVIPDLAECDFGLFEMMGYEELKEREDYIAWITDDTGEVACPGGESKKQAEARIRDGYFAMLEAIRRSEAASAVAVCHGGVISCIMELLQPGVKDFYSWQPLPGRGYTLRADPGKPLTLYTEI